MCVVYSYYRCFKWPRNVWKLLKDSLAAPVWGPKFDPQNSYKKLRVSCTYNPSTGETDRRIPGACRPVNLAKPLSSPGSVRDLVPKINKMKSDCFLNHIWYHPCPTHTCIRTRTHTRNMAQAVKHYQQAWKPEINPQDPHGGHRELTS